MRVWVKGATNCILINVVYTRSEWEMNLHKIRMIKLFYTRSDWTMCQHRIRLRNESTKNQMEKCVYKDWVEKFFYTRIRLRTDSTQNQTENWVYTNSDWELILRNIRLRTESTQDQTENWAYTISESEMSLHKYQIEKWVHIILDWDIRKSTHDQIRVYIIVAGVKYHPITYSYSIMKIFVFLSEEQTCRTVAGVGSPL